jgi:hypothetical protein
MWQWAMFRGGVMRRCPWNGLQGRNLWHGCYITQFGSFTKFGWIPPSTRHLLGLWEKVCWSELR